MYFESGLGCGAEVQWWTVQENGSGSKHADQPLCSPLV